MENKNYKIVQKNDFTDIAFLGVNSQEKIPEDIFNDGEVGNPVYAFVFREGQIKKISGKIIAKNQEIIGYESD